MKRCFSVLKEKGIKGLIKFLKLHFEIKKKQEYYVENGVYILKKTNDSIFFKQKEINVGIDGDIDIEYLNKLNNYGYKVNLVTNINYFPTMLPVNSISADLNVESSKDYLSERLYGNLKIDLTIVILNYNNKNCIFKCLDLLEKYNDYNYKIIVVDNNSKDGSYEKLKSKYSQKITLIRNKKNGCSSGRNLGMKFVKTKYVMFLDSDQFVTNHYWLDNYIKIIDTVPNFGVLGWACGWFDKKRNTKFTNFDFAFMYMPPYGLVRSDIGYLGTGGMILKTDTYNQTSGFDIAYDPTGYEDTDFTLQIKDLGLSIYYSPYLGIYHEAHQSTKNSDYNNLLVRNSEYFKKKWKDKDDSFFIK